MAQIIFSGSCMVLGVIFIALRGILPYQVGTFGACASAVGALVATPLLAAIAAALLQRWFAA